MTIHTEHANAELFAALAKAQGEIENASKSSTNPHFRSKYADLAEVLNTVRPSLTKNGLSLIQSTGFDGAMVNVTTILAHAAGGYISCVASCVPAKSDAQGIGSATTYLRRYSAAAVTGIAQEDDDGQSAAHDRKPEPKAAAKPLDGQPLDGVWDALHADDQAWFTKLGVEVVAIYKESGAADALDHINAQGLDTDGKAALWHALKPESAIRTALTKEINARKGAK